MTDILMPDDCTTMREVRAGVDATDSQIVALLGRRFGYMAAAARIKKERAAIRDETRKAQVIENARAHARAHGVPEALVTELWDRLVEGSIAHEMALFEARERAAA